MQRNGYGVHKLLPHTRMSVLHHSDVVHAVESIYVGLVREMLDVSLLVSPYEDGHEFVATHLVL